MADYEGVLLWAIRKGSEISLGPVLGDLFAYTVIESWERTWPERYPAEA